MTHRNAPLTPEGRRRACLEVDRGRPICHVAAEFRIARQTLGKWHARWVAEGEPGLEDRASRPLSSPRQTPVEVEDLIEQLRKVPARIRFLSVEPLIEDVGQLDLSGIHWVIVGGESGPKARPMKPEWLESVRVQCEEQRVAFFFKQWGGWGADGKRRAKSANGRLLNGRIWDEMPHALPTL